MNSKYNNIVKVLLTQLQHADYGLADVHVV